jgi:hypothetical protein
METLPTGCILLGMTFFNAAGGFIRSTIREITFSPAKLKVTNHTWWCNLFDSVLEEDTINLAATESISIAPLLKLLLARKKMSSIKFGST